jgi:hypothetical protein
MIPNPYMKPFPTPGKGKNYLIYILAAVSVILVAVVIFLLVRDNSTKSTYIPTQNCPKVYSEYASVPNVNPNKLVIPTLCGGGLVPDGSLGNAACTFSNIPSVYNAQIACNKYSPSVCSGYFYNNTTKVMSFINNIASISSEAATNSNYGDTFIKQVQNTTSFFSNTSSISNSVVQSG